VYSVYAPIALRGSSHHDDAPTIQLMS